MNRTNLSLSISYAIHKNREAWQEQQLSLKIDEALEKVRAKATDVPTGNFVNGDTEFEVKHHDDFEGDSLTYKVDPETGESTLIGTDDKLYINIPDTVEDPVVGENEPPKLEKRSLPYDYVEVFSPERKEFKLTDGALNKDMCLFVPEEYLNEMRLGPVQAAINEMFRTEMLNNLSMTYGGTFILDGRGLVHDGKVVHSNFGLNFTITTYDGDSPNIAKHNFDSLVAVLLPSMKIYRHFFKPGDKPKYFVGADYVFVDEYPSVFSMSMYTGVCLDEVVTKDFPLKGTKPSWVSRVLSWFNKR